MNHRSAASLRAPAPGTWHAALIVIKLHWVILRRRLHPTTAHWSRWLAFLAGLALAAATIVAGAIAPAALPTALALWWTATVLAPVLIGSTHSLRAEALLGTGLPRRRLLVALFFGTVATTGSLIVVAASASVIVPALSAPTSAVAVLVAAVGALTTALLLVATLRCATACFAALARRRSGAIAVGTITGALFAVVAQGWTLIPLAVSNDTAAALTHLSAIVPSGYATSAVSLARSGAVLQAGGLLLAQLAAACAAAAIWGLLESRRLSQRHAWITPVLTLHASSAKSAARGTERRGWSRDPVSLQRWSFAAAYAVGFCALPALIGWREALPFIAPAFVTMIATLAGGTYARTGTTIWAVLAAGGARADVRARQWGLITRCLPLTVLAIAVVSPIAADRIPAAVAATVVALGAAAGLTVALGVALPGRAAPRYSRAVDPLESRQGADTLLPAQLAFFGSVLLAAPAGAAGWVFGWWAVIPAAAAGVAVAWCLGSWAIAYLARSGDALLGALRSDAPAPLPLWFVKRRPTRTARLALPRSRRIVGWTLLWASAIAIVPQGILPLVFISRGIQARAWFLAMHQPAPTNTAVAIAMIAAGAGLIVAATITLTRRPKQADLHAAQR